MRLHCDALVNNQLLLHIVCFFVVGSLNSSVVNQLHHAQCTSTFFCFLKPNCIIECTSPHNLCAIHGHADNKCKEIALRPKSFFLQTSHLIFKLTFYYRELFSFKGEPLWSILCILFPIFMGLGNVATQVLFCGNYCRAFTMSYNPFYCANTLLSVELSLDQYLCVWATLPSTELLFR